ncbi:MAG: hypothetical protein ABR924_03805 [Terracidiphilus sp.]
MERSREHQVLPFEVVISGFERRRRRGKVGILTHPSILAWTGLDC